MLGVFTTNALKTRHVRSFRLNVTNTWIKWNSMSFTVRKYWKKSGILAFRYSPFHNPYTSFTPMKKGHLHEPAWECFSALLTRRNLFPFIYSIQRSIVSCYFSSSIPICSNVDYYFSNSLKIVILLKIVKLEYENEILLLNIRKQHELTLKYITLIIRLWALNAGAFN